MNKLYVLPVGRNRKWEVITQNVLRGASGPRKQKIHRAQSSANGWFVWTRWMYAKFMCSNHTNHTSYNHSHSRVNSRSRFEVSVRISWSKVCVFGRHWQATTINNGFAIRFSSVLKIFTSFFLEMRYCSFLLTFCELSVYLRAFSPFSFLLVSCLAHFLSFIRSRKLTLIVVLPEYFVFPCFVWRTWPSLLVQCANENYLKKTFLVAVAIPWYENLCCFQGGKIIQTWNGLSSYESVLPFSCISSRST